MIKEHWLLSVSFWMRLVEGGEDALTLIVWYYDMMKVQPDLEKMGGGFPQKAMDY